MRKGVRQEERGYLCIAKKKWYQAAVKSTKTHKHKHERGNKCACVGVWEGVPRGSKLSQN